MNNYQSDSAMMKCSSSSYTAYTVPIIEAYYIKYHMLYVIIAVMMMLILILAFKVAMISLMV